MQETASSFEQTNQNYSGLNLGVPFRKLQPDHVKILLSIILLLISVKTYDMIAKVSRGGVCLVSTASR